MKSFPPQLASTRNIIDSNLFDPERGASKTKEVEASSAAMQRLRGMVLLGTAILGQSRYAILQEPANQGAQKQSASYLRLQLGDTFEGFSLSEIEPMKVAFTKGPARVDIPLDFFRRVEDGARAIQEVKRAPTPPRQEMARKVEPPPAVDSGVSAAGPAVVESAAPVERAGRIKGPKAKETKPKEKLSRQERRDLDQAGRSRKAASREP